MRWETADPDARVFEGTDVYFQWRLGAGAVGCGKDPVRPIVVRLEKGKTGKDFAGILEDEVARVPGFYRNPIAGLEKAEWCTAMAREGFFELLGANSRLRDAISRIAVLPTIVPQDECGAAPLDEDDERPGLYSDEEVVVIGVIDYGLAFAHERFWLSNENDRKKSRIEYMWVQDAPAFGHEPDTGNALDEAPAPDWRGPAAEASADESDEAIVNPVPYGAEITSGNINALMARFGRCGTVDEDALYRYAAGRLGRHWLRSVSRRGAHGTHVMDLAGGYRLDEAERRRRPIVCVQLPEATTADTSGENLDAYALDGIRYILERADAIARRSGRERLPVVINFSYGNVAGPHDGTSDLELAIDELIEMRRKTTDGPLEVILPAGNSHLARLHAQVSFKRQGEPVNLRWRVLPDDRTPSFMEVWLPADPPAPPEGKSRIKLRITTPGGVRSGWLDETTPGAGQQLVLKTGEVLCEARYRYIGEPTKRGMFLIALEPTRRNEPLLCGEPANPVAPSGTWTVTLENTGLGQGPVEAWIQRDDTPYGFPRRGRQSYFDDPDYVRFDAQGREIEEDGHDHQKDSPSRVKRAGSINSIATGRKAIVVGGSLGNINRPAPYSAGGPITARAGDSPAHREGPDMMAVSDDSIVHRGVLAAGTRSGSVVAMNGTSVAAPQVTRHIAGELARGRPGEFPSRQWLDLPDASSGPARLPQRLERPSAGDAAPGHPMPGKERVGAGRLVGKRPAGASPSGARRFDRSRPNRGSSPK